MSAAESRRGPQGTDRGAGSHTLKVVCEMDTSAGQEKGRSEVNLISIWNVTSHADETEIRAVTVLFRMRLQTTARLWCITQGAVKQPVRTRLKQAWSLCAWQCFQVEPLWGLLKRHQQHTECYDMEPRTTALNNTTVVFLVWTRGVLVWLMVVATDTIG